MSIVKHIDISVKPCQWPSRSKSYPRAKTALAHGIGIVRNVPMPAVRFAPKQTSIASGSARVKSSEIFQHASSDQRSVFFCLLPGRRPAMQCDAGRIQHQLQHTAVGGVGHESVARPGPPDAMLVVDAPAGPRSTITGSARWLSTHI